MGVATQDPMFEFEKTKKKVGLNPSWGDRGYARQQRGEGGASPGKTKKTPKLLGKKQNKFLKPGQKVWPVVPMERTGEKRTTLDRGAGGREKSPPFRLTKKKKRKKEETIRGRYGGGV